MSWGWLRSELAPDARIARSAPWCLVAQPFDDHVAWQAQVELPHEVEGERLHVVAQGSVSLPHVFTNADIAIAMHESMSMAEQAAEALMTEPQRKVA